MELDEAVKYVAGAYAVFVALLLVYVGIIAARMDRMRRELGELAELAERRRNPVEQRATSNQQQREPVEVSSG